MRTLLGSHRCKLGTLTPTLSNQVVMKSFLLAKSVMLMLLVATVSACRKDASPNKVSQTDKVSQSDVDTNLVSDGSFEQPDIPTGTVVYEPTGSAWAFVGRGADGAPGIIDPPGRNQFGSFNGYAANDGIQYAFLQSGNDPGISEISQTVTLKTSGTYELLYLEASRSGRYPGGDLTYQVLLDSQVLKKISTSSGQMFMKQGFQFEATQGTHLLRFVVPKGQGDNTVFIDRVSLAPTVLK